LLIERSGVALALIIAVRDMIPPTHKLFTKRPMSSEYRKINGDANTHMPKRLFNQLIQAFLVGQRSRMAANIATVPPIAQLFHAFGRVLAP
jgi:hypothetical protein